MKRDLTTQTSKPDLERGLFVNGIQGDRFTYKLLVKVLCLGNLDRRGVVKHDAEFTGQALVYGVETINDVFPKRRGRPF